MTNPTMGTVILDSGCHNLERSVNNYMDLKDLTQKKIWKKI